MALNYQRNSYILWECANKMYKDAPEVYDCQKVMEMSDVTLKELLTAYKVVSQPNKQPVIWRTLCKTFYEEFEGDIRNFFKRMDDSVAEIKAYIQQHKKMFPYLGGNKINNYWLYVMEQYTDTKFHDRENITVAPDTHVIQASTKLGIITLEEAHCQMYRCLLQIDGRQYLKIRNMYQSIYIRLCGCGAEENLRLNYNLE